MTTYPNHPSFAGRTRRQRPARHRWLLLPLLACALSLAMPGAARAQKNAAEVMAALDAVGLENLSVTEDERELRVIFENRRYRWEVVALGTVLGIATAQQDKRVVVTCLNTGVPLLRLDVMPSDYRAFLRGEISEGDLFARMVITNRVAMPEESLSNSSYGKVDLTFAPGVRITLITPPPPGVLNGGELRLSPGVYAALWRGLTFDGTYTYPLSNNPGVFSRGAATFNSRIGTEGYFQVQGGRLAEDLDGVAAQMSYMDETGKHMSGLAVAQAGFPGWRRVTSYQAFYAFRPSSLDLVATVSAGRFLNNDNGYSLNVVSGFGERNVEFYYTKTDLSRTFGAGFTIPLGWQTQARPAPVRMRFRNAFRFVFTDEKPLYAGGLAVPFLDGYQMAIRRLNRAYLRTYASEMREAGVQYLPAGATKLGE